ncbi:hypothetical protein ACSBR1_041540 [Camellia fascicularis]
MSERSLRRRIPVSNRRATRLQHHPSPPPHRRTLAAHRRSSNPSSPTTTDILQRYESEPTLWTVGFAGAVSYGYDRNLTTPESDAVFFRLRTCTDIFSSTELLLPPRSPRNLEVPGLNKWDVIGDVGSRSFYLRRGNSDRSSSSGKEMISASFPSEIVSATRGSTSLPHTPSSFFFLPPFIARKINKIIRRTRKLWKILGCLHCS